MSAAQLAERVGRPVSPRRARVRVQGTVQGVGFRPFVYRLAREHELAGYVLNDSRGVLLEVEGPTGALEGFLARLARDPPPLAVVERVLAEELAPCGERGFQIVASARESEAQTPVTPDSATCEQCLRELFDPADRRHRYPFINCTNCGPRFTIVCGIPYDRPQTTMAGFAMCEPCRGEYENPEDRRFHAQPNACPACGPAVTLLRSDGGAIAPASGQDSVAAAAAALRDGAILALKGIGGYHLAVRADDEDAVATLRARKHREEKPFALMAGDLDAARRLVALGAEEEKLLRSRARPIVLAPRRGGAPVARAVAPCAPELGVMLPYSPLHHLLLADAGTPLVMTSGNVSDEPIVYRDDEVPKRLGGIAHLVLVHDRPIATRTDDSVLRVVSAPGERRTQMLRRSRGYVPASERLPVNSPRPLLACGAELKSTFCLVRGERAWVSQHIGDLENYETLQSFTEGIAHFERLFTIAPEIVAHDLHPEYLSTKYALERDDVELLGVQHHHAHLAAVLAEHGERGPALGAIFDGTGYGSDGTVWGGELLAGDLEGFERAGMLMPTRMPGGAQAIREPWRMACSWLARTAERDGAADVLLVPRTLRDGVTQRGWELMSELARSGLSSPLTSSVGRLFDAVAALCGVRARVNYEGQAAIELEAVCDPHEGGSYPVALEADDGRLVLDVRPLIAAVAADVEAGADAGTIAARFHNALAATTVQACAQVASARGLGDVVLAGGVFANRRLLEAVRAGLHAHGLRVLTPSRLPIGDGAIAYGQAAIAASRAAAPSTFEPADRSPGAGQRP
jgi:hydrogenase maturation protein HypF